MSDTDRNEKAARFLAVSAIATFLAARTSAQSETKAPAAGSAKVADAFGKVEKKLANGKSWLPVSIGDSLPVNATVRTASGAAALLQLVDGHAVRVGEKTTVVLKELGANKRFSFQVVQGQIWSLVKKANHPALFSVETPSAVAGVTGTFFGVALDEATGETVVSTGEGSVSVRARQENGALADPLAIKEGQMGRFSRHRSIHGPFEMGKGLASAHAQGPQHVQMWRMLNAEGAWARQAGRGPLRMRRNREAELMRLMRVAPANFGPPPR